VIVARLFQGAARWCFEQLYHGWAWAYDTVAAIVSLGRWYDWVRAVQPFVLGPRVLEIGPGTGHLLELLAAIEGIRPLGLDESAQMLLLCRHRVIQGVALVRGKVQRLPLGSASFDTIVATFPPDFIREWAALREMHRVLRPGGSLVILPAAQLVGKNPLEMLMAWALAAVGEAPRDLHGVISSLILPRLDQSGLPAELHELHLHSSAVFVIVSTKPDQPAG